MAENRRYALGSQLDIEQIILEAQHRWLRPAEICEILRNFQKFRISPEPPNRPPNGSLFLFDRKVLRYFRKDGHNWRKKKDGKTVKEAHERLKAGSIDVLHCYYAHGEENENFQRRSYWMLEEELSHIVLVHYREVKGNRTNFNRIREAAERSPGAQGTEDDIPSSEADSTSSSKFQQYNYRVASQITDTTSHNSAQASEYEDAESAYTQQSNSSFNAFLDLQPPMAQKMEDGRSVPYFPAPISDNYQGQFPASPDVDFLSITTRQKDQNIASGGVSYMPEVHLDYSSWGNVMEGSNSACQSINFPTSISSTQVSNMSLMPGGNDILGQVFTDSLGTKQEFGNRADNLEQWQEFATSTEENTSGLHNSLEAYDIVPANQKNSPVLNDLTVRPGDADGGNSVNTVWNGNQRQPLLDGVRKEGLKKLDSFDRWISKELGDVNESRIQSNSTNYWESVGNEDDDSNVTTPAHIDAYMMGPSLSQDQLFSIIDFSPNWAFSGSEIKVLITGKFLKSQQEVEKCKWACMFGELEVPAEVIADGVLRCRTPLHAAGRVPFYVTSSNRFACSEVREFEFHVNPVKDEEVADMSNSTSEESCLLMRFVKLLNLTRPLSNQTIDPSDLALLTNKIDSLVKGVNDEWEHMRNLTSKDRLSVAKLKDRLLEKLLRDKLYSWLIQKVAEGGKGPSVLDEDGQGILHFAAALDYDWAIPPTVAAGVGVNFRDVNGWTALHWAASYGRERIVALLTSLKANPGALTDPTPKYPSGRMAAELASSNGHKGIAGYLAESALSSHLSSIQLKDKRDGQSGENSELEVVQTVSERTATPIHGELSHGLSLKDSLAAVRNATQAAARIHEVFRVQSFQRKQIKEYGDSEFGISDERALSLLAIKSNRAGGRHDEPVTTAAIRIQNKFRSWKGRKEFLLVRQRIIKIQAHVRGHQVRKNYRKIIWSVGILDKVILRWRRKGSGLRGFKSESLVEGSRATTKTTTDISTKEDDYDFLKEGRRQTEDRLQKALARVKSMVQYPEARDQYRRVLNVVSEMQAAKAKYDRILNSSDETAEFDDDLIDLDALLEDDTSMAAAS